MADPSDAWLVILGIVGGILSIASGVAVRLGHLRYQLRDYMHDARPLWYGNLAMGQIPGGVALLLTGCGWLVWAGWPDLGAVAAAFLSVGFASGATAVVWLVDPPGFAKPEWLRELESRRGDVARADRSVVLSRIVVWPVALVMLVLAIVALAMTLGIIAALP